MQLQVEDKGAKPKINSADKRSWYVVKVMSGKEHFVAHLIGLMFEENVVEVHVMNEDVVTFRKDKPIKSKKNSYPGYLFIKTNLTKHILDSIESMECVSAFVGSVKGSMPQPIPNAQANKMFEASKNKTEVSIAQFAVGDDVKIVGGPFVNMIGRIEEVLVASGKDKIKVSINVFDKPTDIYLTALEIEKIKE